MHIFSFLITVDVRVSLRAPQLIPRGSEVNDRVNLQWPWGDSNWWPLGSKPKAGPTELPLRVYNFNAYVYHNPIIVLLALKRVNMEVRMVWLLVETLLILVREMFLV